MAEQLFFNSEDKLTRYTELRPQLEALLGAETDAVANMANFCAALKEAFGWFWIGFFIFRLGNTNRSTPRNTNKKI